MGYQGYLIKVGDYDIPLKYINTNTCSVHLSVQDLDSYRDANGVLHRTALSHVPCKIEFETPPMLTGDEFEDLMGNIRRNYLVDEERKVKAVAFVPEINDYVEQEMYMPDITPTIYGIRNGEIRYNSIRLAFIGY